jgi:hypothetical protein
MMVNRDLGSPSQCRGPDRLLMSPSGRLRRFGRGPVNLGSWHVRDVTPAATRAAAIKGGADIPARSPFMLRPRCRTLRALSCSDPKLNTDCPHTGGVTPGSHTDAAGSPTLTTQTSSLELRRADR